MKHGFGKITTCAITAALCLSMSFPSMAATKAEVQQQIEDLKSQQTSLEGELSSLRQNKTDTESYITELDTKIQEYLSQLEEVSQAIEDTDAQITLTQADLETAKQKEQEQYKALKARIKVIYESGDTSYLQMLLSSDDLKSLLNNQEYMSKINTYDQNLLQNLQDIRTQIEEYEQELEDQKALQEAQQEQYELEKESLETIVAQKEDELVAIGANIDDVNSTISDTQDEIDANNSLLAQIEAQERKEAEQRAEAARQAAAAAEAAKQQEAANNNSNSGSSNSGSSNSGSSNSGSSNSGSSNSGNSNSGSSNSGSSNSGGSNSGSTGNTDTSGVSMIWPTGSTYISSYFGYRSSPTAGASTYHQGLDIAGGAGSSIWAAASGTVTAASYSSVLGNYVIISHGNGVSTIYEHCSALYVSAGQSVSRGESIAAVGSTGISTGAHLHFGVSVGGSYVNPLLYVSP